MNIFKKTIVITISIIATLFIASMVVLWTYEGEIFFIAPSYNKMDTFLKTNIDELFYVAGELFEMDYDSITIRKESIHGEDSYSMRVSRESLVYETTHVPSALINHIEALYESGVKVISCSRDSVNFSMWSTMDESRGIIYSGTGIKPNGEQLIEVSQLSEDNWYYYVHNYEKAKAQNPEKFK